MYQKSEAANNQYRKITTTVGLFYILGIVAGILSISYAVDDPDYLIKAAAESNGVVLAAFFHLLMAPIYIGIAILLYPVLKKYNQWLAFGFAAFRIVAGVFIITGVIVLLLLLSLTQEFVKAGNQNIPYFQTTGLLLQTGRDLINHVATILSVSISGLMYYLILFQTKLVPRWLSVWGLAGILLPSLQLFCFFSMLSV